MWPAGLVTGQNLSGGTLLIGAPDTQAFPSVRFSLEAYDDQNAFLAGLDFSDLEIQEDDRTLPVDRLETMQYGLQITLALNTQPSLLTPVQGISPYNEIQTALTDWIDASPTTATDDFSLATPTGLYLIRSTDREQWKRAIGEYQPDTVKPQLSLVSLADALDLATDPLGRAQAKRAILFITPPLPPSVLNTLPDYTSRARQIGVKVFVWMIAAADNAEVAAPLQDLAAKTGGRLNLLSPASPRPDIAAQLTSLRSFYEVQYTSALQTSGTHQLSIHMKDDAIGLASNRRNLLVTVMPPNPIFLSPPVSLHFQVIPTTAGLKADPQEVQLNILVEFPDQHERELKATRLYVNGELAAENTRQPFDQFTWDASGIREAGQQMLRVEAVDTLGISGSSLEIPVEVMVDSVQARAAAAGMSTQVWMALGAVAMAGGALTIVLVTSGRKNKINWRRSAASYSRKKDPITQPVPGIGVMDYEHHRSGAPANSRDAAKNAKSMPLANEKNLPAQARLIGLLNDEQVILGSAIPLYAEEMTFGSDPERASQILASSTVDGLHARIYLNNQGEYFLADNHSVAGTWVNYAPVTGHGARLEDGDLIHIGRVMFRFEQTTPGMPHRTPKVVSFSKEEKPER